MNIRLTETANDDTCLSKQRRQAHHCRQGGPETIIKVSDLNAKQKANQARHF
jgi:hypothetical protein